MIRRDGDLGTTIELTARMTRMTRMTPMSAGTLHCDNINFLVRRTE